MNDGTTRIKMCIEGQGPLEDGTSYTRELLIIKKAKFNGISRAVYDERIEIDGEFVKSEEYEQEDDVRVRNGGVFKKRLREVNVRWSRVRQFYVPQENEIQILGFYTTGDLPYQCIH